MTQTFASPSSRAPHAPPEFELHVVDTRSTFAIHPTRSAISAVHAAAHAPKPNDRRAIGVHGALSEKICDSGSKRLVRLDDAVTDDRHRRRRMVIDEGARTFPSIVAFTARGARKRRLETTRFESPLSLSKHSWRYGRAGRNERDRRDDRYADDVVASGPGGGARHVLIARRGDGRAQLSDQVIWLVSIFLNPGRLLEDR